MKSDTAIWIGVLVLGAAAAYWLGDGKKQTLLNGKPIPRDSTPPLPPLPL